MHTSIQISFALSEYESSVFGVGTSPANHPFPAIIGYVFVVIILVPVFCFYAVQSGSSAVLANFFLLCGAVCGQNLGGAGGGKSVPATSLVHMFLSTAVR